MTNNYEGRDFVERASERLVSDNGFFGPGSAEAPVNGKRRCFRWISDSFVEFCEEIQSTMAKFYAMGREDPRKVLFAAKVGLALSIVSLIIFFKEPLKDTRKYSIWAVLTVVVVFEFSVGATVSKGLNRGIGTLSAGVLALGIAEMAAQSSGFEEVLIVISIFWAGFLSSYAKLYPTMKPYEYGFRIFLLTFCLVMITGNTTTKFFTTAYYRLMLIAIGASIAFAVNIFIFPIWSGEDLHKLVVKNFKGVAASLEGCVDGYLESVLYERIPSSILTYQAHDDPLYVGYRSAVESSSKEEALCVIYFIGSLGVGGLLGHSLLTLRRQGYGLSSSYPPRTLPIFHISGKPDMMVMMFSLNISLVEMGICDLGLVFLPLQLVYAKWEPPHGPYRMLKYPWQNYVRLAGSLRHCAFMVMALHGCILSEIQAPPDKRKVFAGELKRVGNAGSKVLCELGNKLENMEKLNPGDMLAEVHIAAQELQMKIDEFSHILVNVKCWEEYRRKKEPNNHENHDNMEDTETHPMINSLNELGYEPTTVGHDPWHSRASIISIDPAVSSVGSMAGMGSMAGFGSTAGFPGMKWPSLQSMAMGGPEAQTAESAGSLSLATFASLLIEFVARLENVVNAFDELSELASFKDEKDRHVVQKASCWKKLLACFQSKS